MGTFQQVIQNEAELREILGHPGRFVQDMVIAEIDDLCRDFIERSPFLLLGSSGTNGSMDVSPKGDPAGFVQVMDRQTLLIPDRPGNRRGDTLSNLLQIPTSVCCSSCPAAESLRVNGTAQIVRDDAVRERFIMQRKVPIFVIAMTVREVFFPLYQMCRAFRPVVVRTRPRRSDLPGCSHRQSCAAQSDGRRSGCAPG